MFDAGTCVVSFALTLPRLAGFERGLELMQPILVIAPLAAAALVAPEPGVWTAVALASLAARLALLARPRSRTLAALADCATLLMIAALSGHAGLGSAAWLALLPLHAMAGAHPKPLIAIGILSLAGLAATQVFPSPHLLSPELADAAGAAAAALQALFLCRSPSAPAVQLQPVAALNHELRTPLNAIIGFAGLLRTLPPDGSDMARHRDYARIIEASGEHILAVLEDATGVRSDRARFPRELAFDDPAATVRDAIDMVAGSAAERLITLSFKAPTAPIEADVDRRALRQIVINLLTNAVKFSPRRSDIEVDLRLDGGWLEISVRDQGFGMTAGDIARIGKPFARSREALERRIEGSGLGLAISQRLAEQLDGDLSFESAPGEGTIARLRLPVRPAAAVARFWPGACEPIRNHA